MTIKQNEDGGFIVHLATYETQALAEEYKDIAGSAHFAPLAHKLPMSWRLMQLLDIELKSKNNPTPTQPAL
jgi:monomeric isocitrate dehydrogenase